MDFRIKAELACLSTDEKPTTIPGYTDDLKYSLLLELDTNTFYYYDGSEWIAVGEKSFQPFYIYSDEELTGYAYDTGKIEIDDSDHVAEGAIDTIKQEKGNIKIILTYESVADPTVSGTLVCDQFTEGANELSYSVSEGEDPSTFGVDTRQKMIFILLNDIDETNLGGNYSFTITAKAERNE